MRRMLPAKIDAVSYAVSLVHEEMRYLRKQSDIHGSALERQETRLDRHGSCSAGTGSCSAGTGAARQYQRRAQPAR